MRRYLLPAVVLVVVVAAVVLTNQADDRADPDDPSATAGPALATPLLSVRRAPEWLRQPTTDDQLEAAVLSAMATLDDADVACLSVHRDGDVIAEENATSGLVPGVLQRLATLAAFDSVGARGFTTEVVRRIDADDTDGILTGDLWLIGGADPVLSTASFVDRFGDDRARTSLEELALLVVAQLRADEITEIRGSVVGDESKYPSAERVYPSETWSAADIASNTVGPISALLVNNGFSSFPDTVDPTANGRASDPALEAARLLTDLIEAAGIPVSDGPAVGVQPDAASRVSVATIESPASGEIGRRALLDGTTAEMLFREIGLRSGIADTQIGGLFGVADGLVAAGVIAEADKGTIRAADGSGLAADPTLGSVDSARCDVLTSILDLGPESLAVDSMPDVTESAFAACAPSGPESLQAYGAADEGLTALAGRSVAPNGDVITFTLIVNWAPDPETGALAPRGPCDGLAAALLDAVGAHPVGPGLDQLLPLDVTTDS